MWCNVCHAYHIPMSLKLPSDRFRSNLLGYLGNFIHNSSSGDQITLSKCADIESNTGLRLLNKADTFIVLEGLSTLVKLDRKQANASVVYSIAFDWTLETGGELRSSWQ